MNDLIKDRDERTRKRKKIKRKMDSIIGLSYHDEDKKVMSLAPNSMSLKSKSIRLLDEGYIDNGFVIKKGTMEKYLNGQNEKVRGYEMTDNGWEQTDVLNLTDDFVGTVNLGHMDFATFPIILGEWNKSDLSLVDIGNDRKGLDVNLRLDTKSIFVKELQRMPYDIGISAEFWYSVNDEDTESLSEMLGYYMPVIDEIFIFAYGLVGECGNVNSSGLELKGDFDMKDTVKINLEVEGLDEVMDNLDELSNEVDDEAIADDTIEDIVNEVVEEMDEPEVEGEVNDEPDTEEVEQEVDADAVLEDEDIETDEEVQSEEIENDDDEAEDEEVELEDVVEAAISDLQSQVDALTEENTQLREQVSALKSTNNRLSKKLADEKEKKSNFIAKFSGMAEKMGVDDAPTSQNKAESDYAFGDGIGE